MVQASIKFVYVITLRNAFFVLYSCCHDLNHICVTTCVWQNLIQLLLNRHSLILSDYVAKLLGT